MPPPISAEHHKAKITDHNEMRSRVVTSSPLAPAKLPFPFQEQPTRPPRQLVAGHRNPTPLPSPEHSYDVLSSRPRSCWPLWSAMFVMQHAFPACTAASGVNTSISASCSVHHIPNPVRPSTPRPAQSRPRPAPCSAAQSLFRHLRRPLGRRQRVGPARSNQRLQPIARP